MYTQLMAQLETIMLLRIAIIVYIIIIRDEQMRDDSNVKHNTVYNTMILPQTTRNGIIIDDLRPIR